MMSLFSSFDTSNFKLSSLIYAILASTLFISMFKTKINSLILNLYFNMMMLFFNSITNKKTEKMIVMVMISMAIMWAMLNLVSVLPFYFSLTSQMSAVFSMSVMLWTAMIMCAMKMNLKKNIMHLIPQGSPLTITPLLMLIEITSNLIRPITVSVRLVANILAGHLMMILLSNLSLDQMLPAMGYTLLNTVEMAVALIQSYILCTMMVIYYSEI